MDVVSFCLRSLEFCNTEQFVLLSSYRFVYISIFPKVPWNTSHYSVLQQNVLKSRVCRNFLDFLLNFLQLHMNYWLSRTSVWKRDLQRDCFLFQARTTWEMNACATSHFASAENNVLASSASPQCQSWTGRPSFRGAASWVMKMRPCAVETHQPLSWWWSVAMGICATWMSLCSSQ